MIRCSARLPELPLPGLDQRICRALRRSGKPLGRRSGRVRAALADVVADGRGDDAAVGSADDPHLLRDRRYRRGKGRGGGASAGARRRLSLGLDRRRGGVCRPDRRWLQAPLSAMPVAGLAAPAALAARRSLPVQRPQGGLPEEMPQPVLDAVRALERASVAHLPARCRAGRLVPRLLLGADAGDVRGRHHERLLDGADRPVYRGGKTDRPAAFPPGLPARYCLYGRRRCY